VWTEEWNIAKFIRDGKGTYDQDEVIKIFSRYPTDPKRRMAEANIFINGYY